MLTTPEERKIVRAIGMGQCATQSDYAHLPEFAAHVIDDLEETLARAERAEANLAAMRKEEEGDKEPCYYCGKPINNWERETLAALRTVRDMIVANFECNHPPDDGGDDCDGEDCSRCAAIGLIDPALGEEKAHG